MRKTLLILSAIFLFFAGCKKDDVIEASKVEVNNPNIEKGWDYVKISAEYDYPEELVAISLLLSEKEDMSGEKTFRCNLEGKAFNVEANDLKGGIEYYYQFEYDNGYGKEKSEKENFATYVKPVVVTNEVTNTTANSAMLNGSVTNHDADVKVEARGFCWGKEPELTIEGTYTTNGTGTGAYSHNLTNLEENTTYYVRAYVETNFGIVYGEEKSFTTEDESINGHAYVDLGLPSGLLWATCNVGANSPEEYGNHYAWGETEPAPNNNYTEDNCSTFGLSIFQLQSQGYIDVYGNLSPSYDAATANWGGSWRMPTRAEQEELLNNCTWTWTTQSGVNGYKVTGPNDNYIFLPAAGWRDGSSHNSAGEYGSYWGSTPKESSTNASSGLDFTSFYQGVNSYFRDGGQSVRPVSE